MKAIKSVSVGSFALWRRLASFGPLFWYDLLDLCWIFSASSG
jgi:hypothetical protein